MLKRTPLNQRQKEALWVKQRGLCAVETCRKPLVSAGRIGFEDDHWTPLHLGGSNELSNRRLICVPCHRAKTIAENKLNAKAKRIKYGRTRKGRPMDGSRDSPLKKHMDGSVSRR